MANETSKFLNELTNRLLGGLTDELVNGDGFEVGFHQFCDSGQGGRDSEHGEWCQKFVKLITPVRYSGTH